MTTAATTQHPLTRFFRPRSVVLVGATEKSLWSQLIHANFANIGYTGDVYLVNKRGAPAHGRPAATSCTALGTIPDIAYVFVPQDAVIEAAEDVAAAGIPNMVVLTSGFAEAGAEGRARQARLAEIARQKGVTLLGPNSLGYVNFNDNISVSPIMTRPDALRGSVAIISQSGATASVLRDFAEQQGIGLSTMIATGNEAGLDTTAIIDYLIEDEGTRVITFFAETINDPEGFRRVARKAWAAKKPLIVLKVGRTELATQLAQAHTGSVTGDDAIFDAVCRQENVIRASAPEDMMITAGVLAHTGPIEGGVAIISISGGACEMIADRAETEGLPLPPFSAATAAAIHAMMPDFGSVFNPLDVTGAAVRDPSLFERILKVLAADPAVGLTACVYDVPRWEGDLLNVEALSCIGRGLSAAQTPGFIINQSLRPVMGFAREVMARCHLPAATGGLDHAVIAFAAAKRWSDRLGEIGKSAAGTQSITAPASRLTGERDTLAWLGQAGVPVVPQTLATTAVEAVAAASALGGPVVLKIASPDIQHKSDVGGVRLNLMGDAAVADAFESIMASARAAKPDAMLEGCIVSPMRERGIELFVGTAASPWGPVIAAGLGGIWIEALADTSLRLLPVSEADAEAMLGELRGRRILDGYRGQPAADIKAVARAIKAIGDAALALGPDLVSLEINPLVARGDTVEALDALPIWKDAPANGGHA